MQNHMTLAQRVRRGGRVAQHLEHPVRSWQNALAYFKYVVGLNPTEVYERALPSPHRRAVLDPKLPSIQKTLYNALLAKELPAWTSYLKWRVGKRGWDASTFAAGLPTFLAGLPKTHRLTQGQRWHLFTTSTDT